jgi:hypothetical protein
VGVAVATAVSAGVAVAAAVDVSPGVGVAATVSAGVGVAATVDVSAGVDVAPTVDVATADGSAVGVPAPVGAIVDVAATVGVAELTGPVGVALAAGVPTGVLVAIGPGSSHGNCSRPVCLRKFLRSALHDGLGCCGQFWAKQYALQSPCAPDENSLQMLLASFGGVGGFAAAARPGATVPSAMTIKQRPSVKPRCRLCMILLLESVVETAPSGTREDEHGATVA